MEDIPEGLLKEVKEKLRVSWDDDDDHLTNLIKDAKTYLSRFADDLKYEGNSVERYLLKERVRYDWHNALDEFEDNFASELSAFIFDCALRSDKDVE